jgi:ABC-type multidrug transport system fused ATPase/permease subunit
VAFFEQILSLPSFMGALVLMVLTTIIGVAVYLMSYRFLAKGQTKETRRATSGLFRVLGILVSLFLSLTFADVVLELNQIKASIEREAIMIVDIHRDLGRYDSERAVRAQTLLVEYTQAVIDYDWPALANDRMSVEARSLLWQLEEEILHLETNSSVQEILRSRIVSDVDVVSDLRLSRLEQALSKPPMFLIVVIFGFLATMVCFGPHKPNRLTVVLLSLYTLLVGPVIYMILAFSDPFQGAIGMDPTALEYVLEEMLL